MAGWSLSLLANQAEAFLEQVDRQAATSLGEESESNDEENIFSTLNSTATTMVNTPLSDITRTNDDNNSPLPVQKKEGRESLADEKQTSGDEAVNYGDQVTLELMKQELYSMSEEMRSYQIRFKQYQTDTKELERRNEGLVTEVREHEKKEKSWRNKEEDLDNAILAKDAQLGVLKVQLAETHAQINTQIDMISSLQSTTLGEEKLEKQIASLEEQIVQERTRRGKLESTHSIEMSEMKIKLGLLEETVEERNASILTEKRKVNSFLVQLQQAKKGVANAEEDLSKYKERATRILQSKDSREKISPAVDMASLEQAISERFEVERELKRTLEEVGELRTLLGSIDLQHQQELQESVQVKSCTEERLKETALQLHESQCMLAVTKQELTQTRQKLDEIQRQLRRDMESRENKSSEGMSEDKREPRELQTKLHSLTEVLLTKQSECEALHSEKSSLVLKLESMEHTIQIQDLKHKNAGIHGNHSYHNSGNHSSNTRKLREAVHTIDKFSIRLGVFLRRYPAARMMVIGYMALLHVWVMVVLLTYSPEVHNTESS